MREPTAKTSSGLWGQETTTPTDPCVVLSLSFAHYFYSHIVIFLFTSSCYENQYTYRDMRISSFLQVFPLSFRWDYKTRLVAKVPRSVKRTFASGSFPGFFFLCAPLPLSWTVSFPKLSAGKITFYCTSRSYSLLNFHHDTQGETVCLEWLLSHLRSKRTPSPGAGVVYCTVTAGAFTQ